MSSSTRTPISASEPSVRIASAATTRSGVSTRWALTRSPSVSNPLSRSTLELMRSSSSTTAADRASSAVTDSRRCRGHARSTYSPKVAGRVSMRSASAVEAQSTTMRSHCPVAASSPTACSPSTSWIPGNAESSSGAMLLNSESGNRRSSVATTSCQRFPNSAKVSNASASRNPPPASAFPVSRSASTRTSSPCPLGGTATPSTSPTECAWSVETTSTRRPSLASLTAVADARVDFPTPPLPTKRLIRAGVGATDSLSLDSLLQILQSGIGQPALGLALEQPDHRHRKIHRQLVGDFGTRTLGRHKICPFQRAQQRAGHQRPADRLAVRGPRVGHHQRVFENRGVQHQPGGLGIAVGILLLDFGFLVFRNPLRIRIDVGDDFQHRARIGFDVDRLGRLLCHLATSFSPALGPTRPSAGVPGLGPKRYSPRRT